MGQKDNFKLAKVIVGVIIFAVIALVFTHIPDAFAQGVSGTQAGDAGGFVPCGNEATNPCTVGHLFSAFIVIINYLIAMAGFIAVVAIVVAGLQMVYSQGQEGLKEAKGRLSGAVIGLVLVAAAFIGINAIFAGSLSVGVKEGGSVLTSPLEYIKNGPSK